MPTPDSPVVPHLIGALKPKKWAHNPGPEVPTVTLADGTVAEAMAALGYFWDATDSTFVKASVDHGTQALKVYVAGQAGGGGAVTIADGADVAQGAVADAAYVSGSGTIVAILKGIFGKFTDGTLRGSVKLLDTGGANVGVIDSSGALSANLTKLAGTAVDTNSGSKSAGTQRVVIATDQVQLTNAWKVDPSAVTSPVSLASLPALAAGTALVGKVYGSDSTDTIYNGTTALTPKFAKITASSSGATQIVAAVSSKKIRVLAYVLVANAAVNAKFQSHTAGDITGLEYLAANGGVASPYSPVGHFETTAGEALDINLSGNVAVGGHLTYIEV